MSIFNSLGSNYSTNFVFEYLFSPSPKKSLSELEKKLEDYYGGVATLTYKGRQALELAVIHAKLPSGSSVGINGFTCYVLYEAVVRAGLNPIFLDVAEDELNFGAEELKKAHRQDASLKAIIVQNTLGLPADMEKIRAYCHQNDIIIIEDLAHSLGMAYADGQEAGRESELVMLSFSQDKPLDVVAGGALIDRRKGATREVNLLQMNVKQRIINRAYPFWSSTIRHIYGSGLGRFLHAGLKALHLMATPMSDDVKDLYAMTPKAATLLLKRWDTRQAEFDHRRKIAEVYSRVLPSSVQYKILGKGALFLRFPIKVSNRQALIAGLKNFQVYIGDTWYDAPIGPKRYLALTDYRQGECPRSESVANEIVNLPTHINISEKQAIFVAEKVKQWLESK